MRPDKFIAALLALSLPFSLCLTGCSPDHAGSAQLKTPGEKTPVEIKVAFWGAPDEVSITSEIISRWQKTHPES